jgi:hypothetical protein
MTSTLNATKEWLKHDCPTCGSKAGYLCVRLEDHRHFKTTPCAARKRLGQKS